MLGIPPDQQLDSGKGLRDNQQHNPACHHCVSPCNVILIRTLSMIALDLQNLWSMQEASELWSDQHAWFPGSPEILSPQQPASPMPMTPLPEAKQPLHAVSSPHIWQASASLSPGAALKASSVTSGSRPIKASLGLPGLAPPITEPEASAQLDQGSNQSQPWTIPAKVMRSQVRALPEQAPCGMLHISIGNEIEKHPMLCLLTLLLLLAYLP